MLIIVLIDGSKCFMTDVLKQLEIEKQNLSDLEARVLFTTDQHTEVCYNC